MLINIRFVVLQFTGGIAREQQDGEYQGDSVDHHFLVKVSFKYKDIYLIIDELVTTNTNFFYPLSINFNPVIG